MSKSLKEQMKKFKKEEKRLEELRRAQQSICPHVSKKKGKSKLVEFVEDGIRKGRCSKCGDVVILDRELLAQQSLAMSADIVKTTLAEIRAAKALGKIDLDDRTEELLMQFDSEVLRELPDVMRQLSTGSGKKKDNGGKKKKKHKGEKKHQRKRFY